MTKRDHMVRISVKMMYRL